MFEPFKAASTNAKILHVFLLLFVFMSWISTIVTFSSPLAEFDSSELFLFSGHYKAYWNHLDTDAVNHPSGRESVSEILGGGCKAGSEATLAFAIFAFILSLFHWNLLLARIGGWNFPSVRDSYHSVTLEMLLAMGTWFCFFVQVCVWGGSCYTSMRSSSLIHNLKPTGFSYMLACFFFLLAVIVGYVRVRQNSDLALGNGANKAGSNSSYREEESVHSSEDSGSYSYQGSAAL